MHKFHELLCFYCYLLLIVFYPYHSRLFHWHWSNRMIVPVPVKQLRRIRTNHSYESPNHRFIWIPMPDIFSIMSSCPLGNKPSLESLITYIYMVSSNGIHKFAHKTLRRCQIGVIASQTRNMDVCLTACSDLFQWKHQSFTSLYRWSVDFCHKWNACCDYIYIRIHIFFK